MARVGMIADPWQRAVLLSSAQRILIVCCRQAGKSTVIAALAVLTALLEAPALVLIVSRAMRQSSELFRKVKRCYRALTSAGGYAYPFKPRPVRELDRLYLSGGELIGSEAATVQESVLQMELANGSRIVSLPSNPDTIAGFSGVALIIIDEAARVPDAVYSVVRPMLSVSRGRLVCASTPYGKRGFFYEEWLGRSASGQLLDQGWQRTGITADQCPRIPREFLEAERRSLGQRWYEQEYLGSFAAAIGSAFDPDEVQRAFVSGTPLTLGGFSS